MKIAQKKRQTGLESIAEDMGLIVVDISLIKVSI
jgi:hypothetical protein